MAKKDVDVRFNLIDNFTASFNKTIQTMTAGTKKAQNAWKSVSKFGDSITGMGTKMSAVVTAPLVGLGRGISIRIWQCGQVFKAGTADDGIDRCAGKDVGECN